MRKTLTIGEDAVTFECVGVTSVYYKAEFKRDFFGDLIKFSKTMQGGDPTKLSYDELDHADFDLILRIAYACYKTANSETRLSYIGFLTRYPEFSIIEHGMEIMELVLSGMQPKKK